MEWRRGEIQCMNIEEGWKQSKSTRGCADLATSIFHRGYPKTAFDLHAR
jgi:hypothetical protein